MRELLEQSLGTGIIGSMAGVGLITRGILIFYYGTLSKACTKFEETKHKTIRYIREDLNQRTKKRQDIKSTMLYTECRLAECKVLGIRVGVLECVARQSLLLVVLSGVLTALAGILQNNDATSVLRLLWMSGAALGGLGFVDMFAGLQEKHKRIRLCIRDYIENTRLIGEADTETAEAVLKPGRVEKKQYRKEKKEEKKAKQRERRQAKKEKREIERSRKSDKPLKACKKNRGKAQEEKRRLTEELLRERRQLEARSFAEQRRKEREEEAIQQVHIAEQTKTAVSSCGDEELQAEVAVSVCGEMGPRSETEQTDNKVLQIQESERLPEKKQIIKEAAYSYEDLFSEVLAEYLA